MTKALLVDDDPDDVDLALLAARETSFPYALEVCRDGQEALATLEGRCGADALPGLVITDIKMPRMDGFELMRLMLADSRLRDIPVVVLSSSTLDSDIVRAGELGAKIFLRKTSDFFEFAQSLKRLGGRDLRAVRRLEVW